MYKKILPVCIWVLLVSGRQTHTSFSETVHSFVQGYRHLHVPEADYDYRNYFSSIPDSSSLLRQQQFFISQHSSLQQTDTSRLSLEQKIQLDHMLYETTLNLERIELELNWIKQGRNIPAGGLHSLEDNGRWYTYFIKRFTSLQLSPQEIMQFGISEVDRVKKEIEKIRAASPYNDSLTFYSFLAGETFIVADKNKLHRLFHSTDSIIRKHLKNWIGNMDVTPIYALEWPQANENTPPGIYLDVNNNAYGKDVFLYNFFGNRYNYRAVEWLYMHEGIPGHHLQSCFNRNQPVDSLQLLFMYPGNFEGWACYVEYEGKNLGVYRDVYSYLGKWEWDLVRSARLVIETGIHFYGWTEKQALDYWKKTIPGQHQIAQREITRVTNWPGQALSYKTGTYCIFQLKEKIKSFSANRFNEARFHRSYLSMGKRPLEVIKKHMYAFYNKTG